jgi:hypothetical protein
MKNLIDDSYGQWYDESIRWFLIWYYWPNFVIGNVDDWIKLGVTLNGIRPVNLSI